MRRLFIFFVLLHLPLDLAVPSAGAFRFNPDESVLALRVQPVQAQELAAPPLMEPVRRPLQLPRLAIQPWLDLRRIGNVPDFVPLLPRRDPSSDRSPQSPAEPA